MNKPLETHLKLLTEIQNIVGDHFPVVAKNGSTLTVSNLHWSDSGAHMMNNITAQKDAKLKERSIDSKLLADVVLQDVNGKTLDSRKNYFLMSMPHITSRNSYIVDGNEVQIINQLRLRPGMYTNVKPGDEVETYLNTTAAGTYKVILDRRTGIIRFKIGTDKKVPVYSVLLTLGVLPGDMQQIFGDLYDVNFKAHDVDKDTTKLLTALWPYAKVGSVFENQVEARKFLESKPLDPAVNKLTVGKPIDKIDREAIEAAISRCIAVSKGLAEEDDSESLAFKSIHAVEDFIPERLRRKSTIVKRIVGYQMMRKTSIPAILPPSLFDDNIKDFMTTSEFTRYSDQNNPIDMNAIASTTTVLGEGGMASTRSVTDAIRAVHASHFGVIDPTHSPEGDKVGVTAHLSLGAEKVGNAIHLTVFDAKTGERRKLSVEELMPYTVAFPDQYTNIGKGKPQLKPGLTVVKARKNTKLLEVAPSTVDYVFNDAASFFSSSTAVVPFLNSNSANRVLMADKHIEQSVQLADPDKPLVLHRMDKSGKGYLEVFGENFTIKSPLDGVVTSVDNETITIKGKTGKAVDVHIHHYYPLNSKTFLHDEPIVAVGDKVTQGQTLVRNNFTKDNTLALGKNLRIAMVPYKGYNFEDGTVISSSAAKKLASVHKTEMRVEKEDGVTIGINEYIARYPQNLEKLRPGFRSNYDANGIIKVGTKVRKNDIIIPAAREVSLSKTGLVDLHKKILSTAFSDISEVWDGDTEGEVIDVINERKFVKVIIKSVEPAVVGDKLSAFAGAKGIITKILGPDEVYKDPQGREIDVLFNFFGNVGRINPGFLLEAAAGKVAEKTGKTFYVDNFNMTHSSNLKHVQDELKKEGIDDEETITNSVTGHSIPNVLVGPLHTLKLKHMVAHKFSARGASGGAYTTLEQPKKEPGESAQRIAPLDMSSLLSMGANAFLGDAYGVKSQKNDDYWTALQLGQTLPSPRTPFVADKFVAMLLSAGVNLNQSGSKITAAPMTDAEVLRMSHGEIKDPSTLRAATLQPLKGGLFDEEATGGIGGSKFAHIQLTEPIINPVMKEAATSVGNFKSSIEVEDIIAGTKSVSPTTGKVLEDGSGVKGIEGIKLVLSKIDIREEIEKEGAKARAAKGSALNKSNRRLRYLRALEQMNVKPVDAYINSVIPIMPPKFRQISEMPDGSVSVADANHGYRELLLINNKLQELKNLGVNDEHLAPLKHSLYQSAEALAGLGSFVTRGREYRGLIEEINGVKESKYGFFKSKMQSRPQDLSARSTVIPNPKLAMDSIGIPTDMALTIYSPFIVKRLVQNGYSPLDARKQIKDHSPEAVRALEVEIEDRPVLMTRAPSLHKFNMLSFHPVLIKGKAVEVNPLIVAGYNMDFDGDTAGIHVPVSEEARKEALDKLLPSRNLLAVRDEYVIHSPGKETTLGIYLMTTPKGTPKAMASMAEAEAAYRKNQIKANTALTIEGKVVCVGQKVFADTFPISVRPDLMSVDGHVLDALLLKVAKTQTPNVAGTIISKIKDLGNHYVTEIGAAVSLKDLEFNYTKRDEIVQRLEQRAPIVGFDQAVEEAGKELMGLLALATDNRFVEATLSSKATGKGGAVQQMIATPLAVSDHKGQLIPMVIRKSYAEGHDLGSYLGTTPGARQGLVDKGISVAQTGYLSKLLVNANIENSVAVDDCGTLDGLLFNIDDKDLINRYGAEGNLRNVLLTPDVVRKLRTSNEMKQILARSPLKCKALSGVCGKCAGTDERGNPYKIGDHVGVTAAQVVGERATQVTLQKFHCLERNTILLVKKDDLIFHTTLGQLFDEHEAHQEDDEEVADVTSYEVWDRNGWTKIKRVLRHAQEPGTEMVMARSRTGQAVIAQNNHPHMLAKVSVACPTCGTWPKRVNARSKKYHCRLCKHVWSDKPETSSNYAMTASIEISNKTHVALIDAGPTPTAAVPIIPDGWLAGMYIAEGSRLVRGDTYEGFCVCQNDGPIKMQAHERLVNWLPESKIQLSKTAVRVLEPALGEELTNVHGVYCCDKGLPPGWSGYPSSWLSQFVAGVIDGDGTLVRNNDSQWVTVRVDTTSFLLAQQLVHILRTVGISARIITTPWRKLSSHQGYAVQFVYTTKAQQFLGTTCTKLVGVVANPTTKKEDYGDVVDYVKTVRYVEAPEVYDIETETGTYFANSFWTHNTGGAAGGNVLGFNRIKQLFHLPQTVRDKAILAEESGVVSSITPSPTGGWFVQVGGTKHFIPQELGVKVNQGDSVAAGQQLSTYGVLKPQDLLEATGDISLVQNRIVDEMRAAYGKQKIKRSIFETIVKPMTDRAKIVDPGDADKVFNVHAGDIVLTSRLDDYNLKLQAKGLRPIKYDVMLLGIVSIPSQGDDFVGQLTHERLKDTIKSAPTLGKGTNLSDGHPVSRLVLKNFGHVEDIKNPPKKLY